MENWLCFGYLPPILRNMPAEPCPSLLRNALISLVFEFTSGFAVVILVRLRLSA